jgi:hypothetical protein
MAGRVSAVGVLITSAGTTEARPALHVAALTDALRSPPYRISASTTRCAALQAHTAAASRHRRNTFTARVAPSSGIQARRRRLTHQGGRCENRQAVRPGRAGSMRRQKHPTAATAAMAVWWLGIAAFA